MMDAKSSPRGNETRKRLEGGTIARSRSEATRRVGRGRGNCSPEDPCPGQTATAAVEASNAVAVLRLALKTPLQRHESCLIFFVL